MKKLKLSLSICMMCLCIAVLCMGILAASSVSYQINGNISYNMIDGIALVNTRVYKIADQKTETELETTATTLSTMTFEAIESSTDLDFILSQKLDTKATLSNGATSDEISAGSINIGFGATDSSVWYYTYYIVINITNLSSEGKLSATLTDNTTYTNVNHYVLSSQTYISKGDTKNIVIALSLSDTTVDSLNIDINDCSLTVESVQTISFSIELCGWSSGTYTFTTLSGVTWAEFIPALPSTGSGRSVYWLNEQSSLCSWFEDDYIKLNDGNYTGSLYDSLSCETLVKSTDKIFATKYYARLFSGGGSK